MTCKDFAQLRDLCALRGLRGEERENRQEAKDAKEEHKGRLLKTQRGEGYEESIEKFLEEINQ